MKNLRILVALDGSPAAETILPAIMPLVRAVSAEVTLFRAILAAESVDEVRAYLERLESALSLHHLRCRISVARGEPVDAVLDRVRQDGHDLVALTTHGRKGLSRLLMGSVADGLVRAADVPLLFNRPDARIGDWKRILIALDGSEEAEAILEPVSSLARQLGAALQLVNVGEIVMASPGLEYPLGAVSVPDLKPYLEKVRARLESQGMRAATETRMGSPAREIAAIASESGAGLIALTTHGRSGIRRAVMGSVAEALLRAAPCPVLIRPLAARALRGSTP